MKCVHGIRVDKPCPDCKFETSDHGRRGFFPLPKQNICRDPNHNMPTHLHIPAGQGYRHICPSCGKEQVAYGSQVTM